MTFTRWNDIRVLTESLDSSVIVSFSWGGRARLKPVATRPRNFEGCLMGQECSVLDRRSICGFLCIQFEANWAAPPPREPACDSSSTQ